MTAQKHQKHHNPPTLSDQFNETQDPQRRHVRMAILELEKVRRKKELDRAMRYMRHLDQRLNEIAREQQQLLIETSPTLARLPELPAL